MIAATGRSVAAMHVEVDVRVGRGVGACPADRLQQPADASEPLTADAEILAVVDRFRDITADGVGALSYCFDQHARDSDGAHSRFLQTGSEAPGDG
jgi:hypothetical protein